MKKGNSILVIPILLVFVTVAITTVGVLIINMIKPYIMYEKLISATTRYMFVIEEYGYLSSNDKKMLEKELIEQGFNKENLQINATESLQLYGETVNLTITYLYDLTLPIVNKNSLVVKQESSFIPMRVIKYGVSKI